MPHSWLYVSKQDLEAERLHLLEAGDDLAELADEFAALGAVDLDHEPHWQTRVQTLLDAAEHLPRQADYAYQEPDSLEAIRLARPAGALSVGGALSDEVLYDHLYGAWLGRCCGCLLGKPVEGWRSTTLWPYLRALGAYPLSDYLRAAGSEAVRQEYGVAPEAIFADQVLYMVEDDDTNYTVTNLALYKQYGRHFTSADVAAFWLNNIPILHTCTAERVAYRNLCLLIDPPRSARYRNPYREWIGAQIRADFWGYVAVGHPERAADYAYRDASVSHVRNGVYGEMWVAAMLAAAPFVAGPRQTIEAGLAQVPQASRLSRALQRVLDWHAFGLSYEEAVARVHHEWDERQAHHWCHAISNAQIVAIGLLWGESGFEQSICRAVQACFDTDCNGASVGSIVGMTLGAKALPEKWIGVLNDQLATGVSGYPLVKLSELARETWRLVLDQPA